MVNSPSRPRGCDTSASTAAQSASSVESVLITTAVNSPCSSIGGNTPISSRWSTPDPGTRRRRPAGPPAVAEIRPRVGPPG